MGEKNTDMDVVPFVENACYSTDQVAKIIRRNPKTVRDMCARGQLVARRDRGGYFITGWQLRAYLENRCCLTEK